MRIFALLLLAIPVYAETIVSVATCQTGTTVVTATLSCSLSTDDSTAIASATINDVLSGLSGQLSVEGHIVSSAFGLASLSVKTSGAVTTAGPVRGGFVKLHYDWGCSTFGVGCTGTVAFGAFSVFETFVPPFLICNFASLPPPLTSRFPQTCEDTVPITLGVPVSFSTSTALNCSSFCGSGEMNNILNFSFYEADRTTPVAFAETPEPATLWLLAAGLISFTARCK